MIFFPLSPLSLPIPSHSLPLSIALYLPRILLVTLLEYSTYRNGQNLLYWISLKFRDYRSGLSLLFVVSIQHSQAHSHKPPVTQIPWQGKTLRPSWLGNSQSQWYFLLCALIRGIAWVSCLISYLFISTWCLFINTCYCSIDTFFRYRVPTVFSGKKAAHMSYMCCQTFYNTSLSKYNIYWEIMN